MLNKNIMNVVNAIKANNYPKFELNFRLQDEKNIVATNTSFLIVAKHGIENINTNLLLISEKDKSKYSPDTQGYTNLCGEIYTTSTEGNFPVYDRILPNEYKYTKLDKKLDGLTLLYNICAENNIILDFVGYATIFKKISKIDFTEYQATGRYSIVTIKNEDVIITIMPMNFEDVRL